MALELCLAELPAETLRLASLRDHLAAGIGSALDRVQLCGPALDAITEDGTPLRLPGNLNLAFSDVDGEALLMAMGNLAVSSGAACTSANPQPSHVLRALGVDEDLVRSSLRFGLGRFNSADDVAAAIATVVAAVGRLRKLAEN